MFEIRKIKKDKWLIILLVGLLLVVIAMPVSDIKSDQTQDEQQVQKAENASEDTYTDALLVRIGMIGINDRCRILQILLLIHIQKSLAILIMVVWNRCAIFIHAAPQDHMCQIIPTCRHILPTINEAVRSLCCNNRIEHYR